jgi:hypothetical protein
VLDEHPDAYFAFADMAEDQDILLLSTADEVFRPEEAYNATAATVYCVDGTGAVKELGTVVSGGSANPLAAVDGHLIYGGHKEMYKVHVDTTAGSLVYDAGAQIRYDKDGNAAYYEGTDPDSMTEAQDSSTFDALLEEYGNAVPVEFRPVTEGSAEGSESAESSGVSIANPVMQVDEDQQLELTGVTLNAPEGAEDVSRTVILMDEYPIAEVSFTYEGRTYNYRCRTPASWSRWTSPGCTSTGPMSRRVRFRAGRPSSAPATRRAASCGWTWCPASPTPSPAPGAWTPTP